MTDFPVLDPIPEQAPLDGESLFLFVRAVHSSDACFFVLKLHLWLAFLLATFPFLPDVDFDFDLDPTPAADGTASPVLSAQVAPEASAHQEVVAFAPAVIVLPAPPVPPVASGVEDVVKSPTAAAPEGAQTPSASISIDASLEDSVVGGFKGALAKASDLELRLRELASGAEMMKTQMHVSTYVSLLSDGCIPVLSSGLFR